MKNPIYTLWIQITLLTGHCNRLAFVCFLIVPDKTQSGER